MTYDLIIIGGGPSGINVAISAKKAGLSHLILEKGMVVNSLFNFPINMTFFSTSLKLEIHDIPFISHRDKPTRGEALEYYRRLVESQHLNISLYEEVQTMNKEQGGYTIQTSKGTHHTRAVCVATGFYDTPRPLGVPGEELPKVRHYYDDPHAYIRQHVLVVGAANSAADAALECYRKGAASVTMAVRGAEINPRVKYWVRPDIDNRIKEGSITAHFNTTVGAIRPSEVDLITPDGPLTIPNDFVLALTGYTPNYALFEALGLEIGTDEACKPVFNPDTLETSRPNVYMAGVACGGLATAKLFIENTRDHGDIIVADILQKSRKDA